MSALRSRIENLIPELIEIRHDLHAHPELGYDENRTSGVVCDQLKSAGIEYVPGLAKGTGVLGFIPATTNPESARTVALRADMDALPILEKTGKPYSSTNDGVMHACGHDGHTTVLLGTAKALTLVEERPNNVLMLFQPAEEGGAGGEAMCKDGALAGKHFPKADVIYGLHGFPSAALGEVYTRVGPLMASASEFIVEITGKGCHAAFPHFGNDPIVIMSHVIVALQSIVSRKVDPLASVVVTVGSVHSGFAHNVIPDRATMHGTLRTLDDTMTGWAKAQIDQVVHGICAAYGATASVEWVGWYPVTSNDAGATATFRRIAAEVIGETAVREQEVPVMGAEDFSFYGRHVPACFFFLGLMPSSSQTYPLLHADTFDFNDDAIANGVELMVNLALRG